MVIPHPPNAADTGKLMLGEKQSKVAAASPFLLSSFSLDLNTAKNFLGQSVSKSNKMIITRDERNMKHTLSSFTETQDKMPRVKRGEEKHNLEILCLLRNEIMCNVLVCLLSHYY